MATIGYGKDIIDWIWPKTKHEKFLEEKYIKEILSPFSLDSTLVIDYNGSRATYELYPGKDLDITPELGCVRRNKRDSTFYSGREMAIRIKITNNRFFISFVVRDLKDGSIITEIRDNKVLINSAPINNFHADDKSIEIRDKYGFIAFRIYADGNKALQIRGYFYGSVCTIFTNDSVRLMKSLYHNDPDYIDKAVHEAGKLKPMFLEPNL
jgi:hypothetical protein